MYARNLSPLDNASKTEAARYTSICFKCLERNHLDRNCTSGMQCNVRVETRTGALYHHPLVSEMVSLFNGITPDDIRGPEGTLMV